jgi:hypothetical protein
MRKIVAGFLGYLALFSGLLALKLSGAIDMAWSGVTAPVWVLLGVTVIVYFAVLVGCLTQED